MRSICTTCDIKKHCFVPVSTRDRVVFCEIKEKGVKYENSKISKVDSRTKSKESKVKRGSGKGVYVKDADSLKVVRHQPEDNNQERLVNVCFFPKHFTVVWARKGVGFGRFSFYQADGKLRIDNEYMSKAFIKTVLDELVDSAELDDC